MAKLTLHVKIEFIKGGMATYTLHKADDIEYKDGCLTIRLESGKYVIYPYTSIFRITEQHEWQHEEVPF